MMNAFGSLLAIVVPTLQQALTDSIGMQGAFLSFAMLYIPSVLGVLLLPKSNSPSKEEKNETRNFAGG